MCCSLNLKPNPPVVDDSGTESGEEVNQKILVQVQGALANLESALPALDPLRRSSVIELLTKLQTSLKLSSSSAADCSSGKPTPPPRKCWNKKAAARQDRHTVGVSSEELQDARRWLEENGYADVAPSQAAKKPVSACSTPRSYDVSCTGSASKQFRPVKFVPPPPKRTHYAEDYIPEPSKQQLQNNSFACPPLQHVQVVENVDKIRTTASSRGSTDSSGDVSDDDNRDGDRRSVSSAQRLLQIASNDHGRKFRQGKRVKLKRPSGPDHTTEEEEEEEQSSGDEYRRVGRKGSMNSGAGGNVGGAGGGMPPFEPKTASDQKYLALLRQAKDDETAAPPVYNPLHGKLQGNWGNRFGRIKTTFERGGAACASLAGSPKKNLAKTFWHDICKCPSDDSIGYRSKKVTSFKPVWSGENGFSHATKSAFRPVAQKAAAFLEPKKRVQPGGPSAQPPKHLQLPLYNSAVTTAHRPFICSDGKTAARPAEDGGRFGKTASQPWNQLPSPCSGTSDLTSRSASPSADFSDAPQPCVTSRVMGSPQTASIVKGKTAGHHRSPLHPSAPTQPPPPPPVASVQAPRPPPRSPRLVRQQRSPTSSPVRMPSVLQKSESWHQMIMGQSKAAARTPLAPPSPQPARHVPQAVRPFEGYVPCKDEIARKQNIVRQHLRAAAAEGGGGRGVQVSKSVSPKLVRLNDDIDKVDDTFENLFKEATRAK